MDMEEQAEKEGKVTFAEILKRAGLRQTEVSQITGISLPMLSMLHTGKRSPSLRNALLLSQALKVPVDTIAEAFNE